MVFILVDLFGLLKIRGVIYEENYSNGEMYYSINPCATYTYNEHHKFRAGLNYNFFTDRWNNTEQKYEDGINNFYVNFGWTYTM